MKISSVGIDLIKSFEGCYLKSYKCPAGVWTIGFGHTSTVDGEPISEGMKITQAKAEQLLKESLEKRYEPSVRKFDGLNQNQYDALVSFCYNLGPGIFTGNLLKSIQSKNWASVADQILLYNKARVNGVLTELSGLTRRRKAEKDLFLKPIKVVDEEYRKSVTKLAQNIKINDASWYPLEKVNLKNVPSLLTKMGGIDELYKSGIIGNKLLWEEGEYKVNHVRSLIVKYASRIG